MQQEIVPIGLPFSSIPLWSSFASPLTLALHNQRPVRKSAVLLVESRHRRWSPDEGTRANAIDMRVNHLNLTVTDPVETQQFLVKYFGLKPRGKGNQNMAFLSDDDGMVLSLMNVKIGRESEVKYPATFHIGFIQESEEQVDEINRCLKADGFDVPPPSRQHGSWTF
jgi:lactoylglutathione lyase